MLVCNRWPPGGRDAAFRRLRGASYLAMRPALLIRRDGWPEGSKCQFSLRQVFGTKPRSC
jgi:hypothetical protein